MKPIIKNLVVAGSAAAIVLFACSERLTIQSFFKSDIKVTQAGVYEKKEIPQPIAVLPKAVPSAPATTQVESNQKHIIIKNKPAVSKQALVSTDVIAEANSDEVALTAATVSFKQVTFKKIDISKLARKMSVANVRIHLNTVLPIAEAENIAIADNNVADDTNTAIAQETIAAAPVTHNKLAGMAYEGAANTAKAQNDTKSPVNITAFSSIRQADNGADTYSYTSLSDGSEELREYATRTGNNTDIAIIVNLGLKSGKKRFFVMDLTSNTIIKSGVVAEGSFDATASYEKKYSNEIGSTATALGIYKVGKHAKKSAYRLQGLQESNNNAFKRAMMLQATEDVPNDEIALPVLKTSGSLSLSTKFFNEISPLLDESAKPVLLWVYDPAAETQPLYSAVSKKN